MRPLSLALGCALLLAAAPPAAAERRCPPDSVPVGPACMDKYEASVWLVPDATTANRGVVKKILKGTIQLEELEAVGAIQFGVTGPPLELANLGLHMGPTGAWAPLPGSRPPSPGIYAVSVAGAFPTSFASWFQMEQACALAGKRLPTNQEWQAAAAGTPDPGAADDGATTCATMSTSLARTGERSACVSSWGAHDMVGNVSETVADWFEVAMSCTLWSPTGSEADSVCFGGPRVIFPGPVIDSRPAHVFRGGDLFGGGVFAIEALNGTGVFSGVGGFRCAR
jgi:hypothetical protein